METKSDTSETIGKKALRPIWKGIPFFVVLLVILLIILPLGKKISAKKADLAKKQSKEKAVSKALTNVITMELIPAMIMEKISLPGIAKPWVSLEVVSEIRGKIVNKKAIVPISRWILN